jgi:hypothetical protein
MQNGSEQFENSVYLENVDGMLSLYTALEIGTHLLTGGSTVLQTTMKMFEDFLWGPSTLSSNTKPGSSTAWCSTLQWADSSSSQHGQEERSYVLILHDSTVLITFLDTLTTNFHKGNFLICLIKYHAVNICARMEVKLHVFLNWALDGGEWLDSRLGHLIQDESVPGTHW